MKRRPLSFCRPLLVSCFFRAVFGNRRQKITDCLGATGNGEGGDAENDATEN
jgi:hypothetical protein